MGFEVSTLTNTGARMFAAATADDKLIISGCGVYDEIYDTDNAKAMTSFTGSMHTTHADLVGYTDNHVIFRASFPADDSYGGDRHTLVLYGHLQSEETTLKKAIAVCSTSDVVRLPKTTDLISHFECLFTVEYVVNPNAITTQTSALETSKAEFDAYKDNMEEVKADIKRVEQNLRQEIIDRSDFDSNCVTLDGEQTINGLKRFQSFVWFQDSIEVPELKTNNLVSDDGASTIRIGSDESEANDEKLEVKTQAIFRKKVTFENCTSNSFNAETIETHTISIVEDDNPALLTVTGDVLESSVTVNAAASVTNVNTKDVAIDTNGSISIDTSGAFSVSSNGGVITITNGTFETKTVKADTATIKTANIEKVAFPEMTATKKSVGFEALLFESSGKITTPLGMPFLVAFVFKDATTALDYTINSAAGATFRLRSDAVEIGSDEIDNGDIKVRHANFTAEYAGTNLDYPVKIQKECFDFSSTTPKTVDFGTYQLLSGLKMGAGTQQGVALVFRIA